MCGLGDSGKPRWNSGPAGVSSFFRLHFLTSSEALPVIRPIVRSFTALLALAICALGSLPAQAPDRAKEIAELENQIAELSKKLQKLKEPPPLLPESWTKA